MNNKYVSAQTNEYDGQKVFEQQRKVMFRNIQNFDRRLVLYPV